MKDPFALDDDGGDTDPSGEPAGTSDVPEEAVGQHLAGVLSNGGGPGDDAAPRSGNAENGNAENGGSRGKTRELGWLERLTNESELVTTADEDGGDPASGTHAGRPAEAARHDPVVHGLFQRGALTEAQVHTGLKRREAGQPLWRAVAALDTTDTDALFEEAQARGMVDDRPQAPSAERPAPSEEHRLAPRAPSPAFARRFEAEVRASTFDLETPLPETDGDLGPLADAGLLPGLDRSGDSAGGYVLNEEPIANISDQWTGAGDGAATDAPAPPGYRDAGASSGDAPPEVETSDRVVSFLLRSGIVEPRQVARAQQRREKQGGSEALWRVLARGKDVDRASIFAEAARVYAFPFADLEAQPPEPEFTRAVADHFSDARRERMIELGLAPWRVEMDQKRSFFKLFLITHDPARPAVHRLAHELDVDRVELQYAPEEDVQALLTDAFPQTNEYWDRIEDDDQSVDLGANYDEDDDDLIDEEELEAEISRSKLINLFEATLVEAVREGASDIHIFPNPDKEVEIHFRTDGRLHPWHIERKVHPEALLAVIKDNSMNVDRFEKDEAQDGFIQRHVDGALIRFRVSIMPIASAAQDVRAESIVIRVLDDRKVITDLSKLGLQERALDRFRHAINQPHGMVIMTGPTGSGKSTTLVAALHEVVSPEVNVLTVEDPVEYVIEDVRQIKLSHKLKLEDALRSILRHDPDVVMVGEMRDRETAELAIKLANTGHLTFSTLHTNDAPSAVSRLYKMEIEPFLIAYAINLVVAQRLIRTLCPNCKHVDDDPDRVQLERLGFSEEEIREQDFYVPGENEDCPTCHGFGYKGRRAISEALHFSREIRHMIVEAGETIDEHGIRQQALSEGMFTLQGSARQVVKSGETSVDEMIRVVATEA